MNIGLPDHVALMKDAPLPRDNGELVFDAPWEARALAMAVSLTQTLGVPWEDFRRRLMHAISEDPDRPYYESWAVALESLVVGRDLATPAAIDAATPAERPSL